MTWEKRIDGDVNGQPVFYCLSLFSSQIPESRDRCASAHHLTHICKLRLLLYGEGSIGASSSNHRFLAQYGFEYHPWEDHPEFKEKAWSEYVSKNPVIWYHWPAARILAKIGFSNRFACPWHTAPLGPRACFKQSPKAFEVVGTNGDCGTDWTTLLAVEDAGFTESDQFLSCTMSMVQNNQEYRLK